MLLFPYQISYHIFSPKYHDKLFIPYQISYHISSPKYRDKLFILGATASPGPAQAEIALFQRRRTRAKTQPRAGPLGL